MLSWTYVYYVIEQITVENTASQSCSRHSCTIERGPDERGYSFTLGNESGAGLPIANGAYEIRPTSAEANFDSNWNYKNLNPDLPVLAYPAGLPRKITVYKSLRFLKQRQQIDEAWSGSAERKLTNDCPCLGRNRMPRKKNATLSQSNG